MQQKSVFVTVVAWIFIILSGLGLLLLALDAALFWSTPFEQFMQRSAAQGGDALTLPPAAMLAMLRWLMALFLLIQAWVLASFIGLLLRKNWARISCIVILVFGLIWSGLYLLMELLVLAGGHSALDSAMGAGMPPGFQAFMQVFMTGSLILGAVFFVVCIWILKKLLSKDISREFLKPADSSGTLAA